VHLSQLPLTPVLNGDPFNAFLPSQFQIKAKQSAPAIHEPLYDQAQGVLAVFCKAGNTQLVSEIISFFDLYLALLRANLTGPDAHIIYRG